MRLLLGRDWPGWFDTGSQARRNGWTAYVLGVVTLGEMGVILIQQATIWEMMPLKQYVPYVIHSAARSDIAIDIEPLRYGMPGFRAMTVTWVSDYVAKRNAVIPNAAIMQKIAAQDVGFIRLRSTDEVYAAWRGASAAFITRAIQDGRQRNVRIVSIAGLEAEKSQDLPPLPWTYIVDYEVIDIAAAHAGEDGPTRKLISHQNFRATLSVTYRQQGTVAISDLYDPERSNAVGFTVIKFDDVELKP